MTTGSFTGMGLMAWLAFAAVLYVVLNYGDQILAVVQVLSR